MNEGKRERRSALAGNLQKPLKHSITKVFSFGLPIILRT